MSGICGFLRADAEAPETLARAIAAQAGRLGAFDGSRIHTVMGEKGAIAVSSHSTASVARHEGLLGAIQGKFSWADSQLAELQRSASAAEALLRGYRQHGAGVVERLRGSFSLAVIDEAAGVAIAATDRLGIESLRHWSGSGTFMFATDEASLATSGLADFEIDPQSILLYLYFHQVPAPASIYRGVSRLLPGQYVRYGAGEARAHTYWRAHFEERRRVPMRELTEEFRGLLRASVAASSNSGDVGCFLSGGTDSSTVTGFLKEAVQGEVKTFSIGFAESGYDEMHYARVAARHFGTRQMEYYVTASDVSALIPRLAQAYGAPFGNSSAVPAYYCAKLARENGVTRMLAGDGGDELFGGNERYARQKLFGFYDGIPAWLRRAVVEPTLDACNSRYLPRPLRKVKRYVEQAKLPMPDRLETYNVLLEIGAHALLAPDLLAQLRLGEPQELQRSWYRDVDARSLINKMLGLDMKVTLADNDLPKVSVACELAGIDVAYPLLGDELLEFALRLHPSMKLKGFELRYFFKEALRGFLADETLSKQKHGFGLPIGIWIAKDPQLNETAREAVVSLVRRGVLRPEAKSLLFEDFLTRHAPHYGTMLWLLVMLEQWFVAHADGRAAAAPAPFA